MPHFIDEHSWTITTPNGRVLSWFDDDGFAALSRWWTQASWQRKHSYQFSWLGRPIIQLPSDILVMQDLIYRIRPTLIIETGVAHGGSAIFHASMLAVAYQTFEGARPHVIAIDITIRPENRAAIDHHPMRPMITLIEGNSTDSEVIRQVSLAVQPDDVVMVVLDSNHSRSHVASELDAYASFVTRGSAIVVMDGVMGDLADLPGGNPDWRADNPRQAVSDFLRTPLGREFEIDSRYASFAITHSPDGVLRRKSGAEA